jgi:hypothetical protein
MRIAAARPNPKMSSTRSGSPMTNDPNTHTMIAAAAVITRAVVARPSAQLDPVGAIESYQTALIVLFGNFR